MNPGLLEYKSPSSAESPEVVSYIVESIDPEGPFGAKEASEGSLAACIPAISNAIFDAIGVRLREAPFTPDRVLAAIKALGAAKNADINQFREHGGALWFKGRGPMRHAADPSRAAAAPPASGDD
jgi:hypothetical protein